MSFATVVAAVRRRWWECTVAAVSVFVAGVVACLAVHAGGARATQYIDNVSQTVAAVVAAVACMLAAIRHRGRLRLAWGLLAASALSWALGQGVWDGYQLVHSVLIPFPSFADAGYLGAVPLAIAGILAFPIGSERAATQFHHVLDGLMMVAALLVVSWDTVLGAVFAQGAGSVLKMVLSLLYPLSDIAVVTMVVLRVRDVARGGRAPLLLVAAGLTFAAVADSSFAYLNAIGTYGVGTALDAGWTAGYLVIALAAMRVVAHPMGGVAPRRLPTRVGSLLPYGPVAAAVGVAVGERATTGSLSVFTFCTVLAVIALVLGRQYLVVNDNVSLMRSLSARERDLHHQANHDALTGLPNRTFFKDAVRRALDEARAPSSTAVLFLDLDDFKQINDTLGHAAGDLVLVEVAERIRASLRFADVAARLGGDEFAVLVQGATGSAQVRAVALRILLALREPAHVDGSPVSVRCTIGVAMAEALAESCDELLRRADVAMYVAKRNGKNRFSVDGDVAGLDVVAGVEETA